MNPSILFPGLNWHWRFVPWPPGKLSDAIVICECQEAKAKAAGKPIDARYLRLIGFHGLALVTCPDCGQHIWSTADLPRLIRMCEDAKTKS